ncbi:hypothetical protein QLX08_011025 [Tetragonisca angustula]|uniref:Uncharacterized protein n=1 Tax=Tetragonisca angustula TaxID=166442 RepID=A0AAW0ZAB8_9HYME
MPGTDIRGLQCEFFPQGLLQNVKGKAVAYHAASLDLWFLNNGHLSTCVHWQGVSIVSISWASPAAVQRVPTRSVREGMKKLSDHSYITILLFTMCGAPVVVQNCPSEPDVYEQPQQMGPTLMKMDKDILVAGSVGWLSSRCRSGGRSSLHLFGA